LLEFAHQIGPTIVQEPAIVGVQYLSCEGLTSTGVHHSASGYLSVQDLGSGSTKIDLVVAEKLLTEFVGFYWLCSWLYLLHYNGTYKGIW